MATFGRVTILLLLTAISGIAGCTSMDAASGGSVAEQVQSFVLDLLRQALAAFVL